MRLLKALIMGTAIMMMSQAAMADDSVGAQEPPEPEYREPPYASLVTPTNDMNEEWWDNEALWGSTDGSRAVCTGECSYVGDEIYCEVPTWAAQTVVVGMDRNSDEKVIMCHYYQGSWIRIGSCELDSLDKLKVDGNIHDDIIGIIKKNLCEPSGCDPNNDCDFTDFISDFESGYLKMYGQGDCDEIWGSQFDDTELEGEYVWGFQGEDTIHLEADELTCVGGHPTALGNEGNDFILGTAYPDYIWGDYCVSGYGVDIAYGYGREDLVYMGDGHGDIVYGGDHNDSLYGGPGNGDWVYGENGNDTLYGGPGTGDYCIGGLGTDTCELATCETISCESTF